MNDLPTPRYRVGDVAWYPTVEATQELLPCPDCLGTRTWKVVTPAGTEHAAACQRCTDVWHSGTPQDLPSLKVMRFRPIARRVVVGSITVKTHPHEPREAVAYMETTYGSGSVYYERDLVDTETAALTIAEHQAAVKNLELDRRPDVAAARRFSDLKLTDAALVRAKDVTFVSWEAFRHLRYALEDLLPESKKDDDEFQDEIREAIERYARYGGTSYPIERHPIDALIEVVDRVAGSSDPDDIADLGQAIDALKRSAGLDLRPELPPCTCEHIGKYSRNPECPRHGRERE